MSKKSLPTMSQSTILPVTFSDFFEPFNYWFPEGLRRTATIPKVNITEDEKSFCLDLAAPGLHKKDFNIDVAGNRMTISGKKEKTTEENDEQYSHKEYNYSSFSRSFTLPEGIKTDKIEASYDGGVLKLKLPKNEQSVKNNSTPIIVK